VSTIRFNAARRATPPKFDGGEAFVPDPPLAPRKLPLSKGQVVFPVIMVAAVMAVMGFWFSNPAMRSGPMMGMGLFLPIMMLGSFGGVFMMNRAGGADNKVLSAAALEEERRAYLVTLDERRDQVQADAARQFDNYQFVHPEPAQLRGLVGAPARMWNRLEIESGRDFGCVRIGTGIVRLAKKLTPVALAVKDNGDAPDYEPVCLDAMRRFLLEQTHVSGIPKAIDLRRTPLMILVGDDGPDTVYGVARAMIRQAALAHPPQEFKVMVVTDDPDQWDWLKWLPHCQHETLTDSGGPARMVWTSPTAMNDAVGEELHNGRQNYGKATDVRPHWLVINDQHTTDSEWDAICRKGVGGVAGVTFVRIEVQGEPDGE